MREGEKIVHRQKTFAAKRGTTATAGRIKQIEGDFVSRAAGGPPGRKLQTLRVRTAVSRRQQRAEGICTNCLSIIPLPSSLCSAYFIESCRNNENILLQPGGGSSIPLLFCNDFANGGGCKMRANIA